MLILSAFLYILVKRLACAQRLYKKVMYTIFFNGIHAMMKNASIPIQVAAFFSLFDSIQNNRGMSSIVGPLLMVLGFLLYPVAVYKYTMKNSDELLS